MKKPLAFANNTDRQVAKLAAAQIITRVNHPSSVIQVGDQVYTPGVTKEDYGVGVIPMRVHSIEQLSSPAQDVVRQAVMSQYNIPGPEKKDTIKKALVPPVAGGGVPSHLVNAFEGMVARRKSSLGNSFGAGHSLMPSPTQAHAGLENDKYVFHNIHEAGTNKFLEGHELHPNADGTFTHKPGLLGARPDTYSTGGSLGHTFDEKGMMNHLNNYGVAKALAADTINKAIDAPKPLLIPGEHGDHQLSQAAKKVAMAVVDHAKTNLHGVSGAVADRAKKSIHDLYAHYAQQEWEKVLGAAQRYMRNMQGRGNPAAPQPTAANESPVKLPHSPKITKSLMPLESTMQKSFDGSVEEFQKAFPGALKNPHTTAGVMDAFTKLAMRHKSATHPDLGEPNPEMHNISVYHEGGENPTMHMISEVGFKGTKDAPGMFERHAYHIPTSQTNQHPASYERFVHSGDFSAARMGAGLHGYMKHGMIPDARELIDHMDAQYHTRIHTSAQHEPHPPESEAENE